MENAQEVASRTNFLRERLANSKRWLVFSLNTVRITNCK